MSACWSRIDDNSRIAWCRLETDGLLQAVQERFVRRRMPRREALTKRKEQNPAARPIVALCCCHIGQRARGRPKMFSVLALQSNNEGLVSQKITRLEGGRIVKRKCVSSLKRRVCMSLHIPLTLGDEISGFICAGGAPPGEAAAK